MPHWIHNHTEHFLCFALIVGRLGDILSTWLVTPNLRLEANPIVRKLGWKFAVLTILVCLVPYYNAPMSVMLLVPSLLVSASNISKVWIARTLGEEEYMNLLLYVAQRSSRRAAIIPMIASALFIIFLGAVMLIFENDAEEWGYWFAMGIITYGVVILIHGSRYILSIYKKAATYEPAEADVE